MTPLRPWSVWTAPEDPSREYPDQATIRRIDPNGAVHYRYVTHDGWSGNDTAESEAEFRSKYPVLKEDAT